MWGTAPAYPPLFYDSEYVIPVKIGTPPQTIYLNLDTGSSDLYGEISLRDETRLMAS